MIQEPSLKDGSFFLPTGERWFKSFLTKKVAGRSFLTGSCDFQRKPCGGRGPAPVGSLCRVREVPLFCTTTHIGFFRKPTTNSAVVGNAPHNLRRRSQVSRTRHRLRNGAARATAFWKEEVPVPHFFVKKDPLSPIRAERSPGQMFLHPGLSTNQWFDFLILQGVQSIWQFSRTVFPPLLHGLIWSACISLKSLACPQMAHLPPWA